MDAARAIVREQTGAPAPISRVVRILSLIYQQHAGEIGRVRFTDLYKRISPSHLFRLYAGIEALDIVYGHVSDGAARESAIATALYDLYRNASAPATDVLFERKYRSTDITRSLPGNIALDEADLRRFLNEYRDGPAQLPGEIAVVLPAGLLDGVGDWMHAIEFAREIRERFPPSTRVHLYAPVPARVLENGPATSHHLLPFPKDPARWTAAGLARAREDGALELTDLFTRVLTLFKTACDQAAGQNRPVDPEAAMAGALAQAGIRDTGVFQPSETAYFRRARDSILYSLENRANRTRVIAQALEQLPGGIDLTRFPSGNVNDSGTSIDRQALAGIQADWIIGCTPPGHNLRQIGADALPSAVVTVSEYDSSSMPVFMNAYTHYGVLHMEQTVNGGMGQSFGMHFTRRLIREARAFRSALPDSPGPADYLPHRLAWIEKQTGAPAPETLPRLLQNRSWAVCNSRDMWGATAFVARLQQAAPESVVFMNFDTRTHPLPGNPVVCDRVEDLAALDPQTAAGRLIVVRLPYLDEAGFNQLRFLSQYLMAHPDQTMSEALVLASVFGDKQLSFSIRFMKRQFFADWLADLPAPLRDRIRQGFAPVKDESFANPYEPFDAYIPEYTPELVAALAQAASRQLRNDNLLDHILELARRTQAMQRFFQPPTSPERMEAALRLAA